ncbi:MAG: indole-3-glycerol phosphate synthase TrpC [Clostridiaceae bacterium]|nr:indole-3-glycerol phosphate synthase TrpC [Clostridiaceae bacterium]
MSQFIINSEKHKIKTVATNTILDRIVAQKKERIIARMEHRSLKELMVLAESSPKPMADFETAIQSTPLSLIAEIKKASPSKGVICENFDPVKQALAYANGGAQAISVLTEQDFFLGCDRYLTEVKEAVHLPILRKDFTIDAGQIYEARILGASAILLIAAILPDEILKEFIVIAHSLGLSVLLEVHTMQELMRALDLNVRIIGINNRDLHTFHVDLATTERLAPMIPAGRTIVSESGIFTAADISRCYRSGVRAVLVGESLMRCSDSDHSVEKAIQELFDDIPGRAGR